MSNTARRGLSLFNKLFMVPIFQLGLGSLVGNKITGYIMVIKSTGRKTGKRRYSPVNYSIHKGNVYCIAGWGRRTDWYRNMINSGEAEIMLPAGTIFGKVEEVADMEERKIILRKILHNAGFAGFMESLNPFTVNDEVLIQKTAALPLLRICPVGIGSGAADAGGLSWVWTPVFFAILLILIGFAVMR
jgi:deazaflavin-dependent oxidoreductase (nitroreductase family)